MCTISHSFIQIWEKESYLLVNNTAKKSNEINNIIKQKTTFSQAFLKIIILFLQVITKRGRLSGLLKWFVKNKTKFYKRKKLGYRLETMYD